VVARVSRGRPSDASTPGGGVHGNAGKSAGVRVIEELVGGTSSVGSLGGLDGTGSSL
jgi:hypothetical protein